MFISVKRIAVLEELDRGSLRMASTAEEEYLSTFSKRKGYVSL